MQTTTVENDANPGFKLTEPAAKTVESKVLAEDLLEIGKRKAQRAIRKGLKAGEECLEETTDCIEHHPWQAVGIAAGAGAFLGALCGWCCTRASRI
jgi:ElaB/YqjD/DUF883 family membrane-anchored ribosome-binding protein